MPRHPDHPVHTVIYGFALAGFTLLSFGKTHPHLFRQGHQHDLYTPIPGSEGESVDLGKGAQSQPQRSAIYSPMNTKLLGAAFVLAIIALAWRVELYRQISTSTECSIASLEVFLPLVIAIYDALRFQRWIPTPRDDPMDASVYESLHEDLRCFLRSPRWRFVPSAACLSGGAYLTTYLWSGLTSTYICPVVTGHSARIPTLQIVALILDCLVACAFLEFTIQGSSLMSNTRFRGPLIWAPILLVRTLSCCFSRNEADLRLTDCFSFLAHRWHSRLHR